MRMNTRFRLPARLLCLTVVAILAAQAAAQCPINTSSQRIPMERLEISGYIEAMAPGKIQVKTVTDQLWLLQITRETHVQIKGSASSPDILKPGMSIAFTALVDRQGKALQPVQRLTIFTPTPQLGYGVIPSAAEGMNGMDPPQGQPQTQSAMYTIAGRITSYKDGKAAVHFGRGSITVDVVDNCEVVIQVSDMTIVKKGDAIEVKGMMPGGQTQAVLQTGRGVGRADQIEIQMAKPLEPPQRQSTIHRPAIRQPKPVPEE